MTFNRRTSSNRRMHFAREGYPFMLAAVIAIAVQLSSPWLDTRTRRASSYRTA